MSLTIHRVVTVNAGYTLTGNAVANNSVPSNTITDDASTIDLGGGIFLTAAHVITGVHVLPSPDKPVVLLKSLRQYIDGYEASSVQIEEGWNPVGFYNNVMLPKNYSIPGYDLALLTASSNLSAKPADLAPLVVFVDQVAANSFLSEQTSINFSGNKTGSAFGSFTAVTADQQFSTNMTIQRGDSGGAAYITDENQNSYIVGVASLGNTSNFSLFDYINQSFYTTINNDLNSAGFTAGASAPDIIMGTEPNEYVRGSVRKANIITDGNNDVILAGSGGGLVNTGPGQNDVVFLPSADKESDPGTTVVVTPGSMTLVGGSSNDKLVLLADRLYDSAGQSAPSENSGTIQLLGGDQQFADAGLSGIYSVYTNGDPELGFADQSPYVYDVSYTFAPQVDGSTNLLINAQTFNDSGPSAVVLWNGLIDIINYHSGDFGLTFTQDSDVNYGVTYANWTNLISPVQKSAAIDDDPTTQWSLSTDSGQISTPTASQLNADLASVLSNVQGSYTTLPATPNPADLQTVAADNTTVSLAAGATAAVTGSNDTINATGPGSTIAFAGTGENASISSGNVNLSEGATATISGNANSIGLDGAASVTLTGSSESVAGTGTGATINLGGQNETLSVSSATINLWNGATATLGGASNHTALANTGTLTDLGSGDVVGVEGTGNQVSISSGEVDLWNNSATSVEGSANLLTLANHTALSVSGSGNSIGVGGTGNQITASSSTINLWSGSGASVAGTSDSFTLYNTTTLTETGSGATIGIAGSGDQISASSAQINLWNNAGATVTGNANNFSLSNNVTLTVGGTGDVVGVGGTGDAVSIASGQVNLWNNAAVSVAGNGDTFVVNNSGNLTASGSGAAITIQGTGDSVAAAAATIAVTNGSTGTIAGNGDHITLQGAATLGIAGTGETFTFSPTPANATISGYDASDTFQFSGAQFANWNALMSHASQHGTNTVIQTDATHMITLANVSLTSLSQSHFQFI